MNDWLKRRAAQNQICGTTRSFVCADPIYHALAYYALASSAIVATAAPGRIRLNRPNPIPCRIGALGDARRVPGLAGRGKDTHPGRTVRGTARGQQRTGRPVLGHRAADRGAATRRQGRCTRMT